MKPAVLWFTLLWSAALLALGTLALTLSGCAGAPHGRALAPSELQAVWAARAAWLNHGLSAELNGCELNKTRVHQVASAREYFDLCRGTGSACSRTEGSSRHPILIVVLNTGIMVDHEGEPVIHELMHFQWQCSKMDGVYTALDRYHQDPRVWAQTGGSASAQAHARELMKPYP